MEVKFLIEEILGGRNTTNRWSEFAEEIAYHNWKNNRKSLPFGTVYKNILSNASPGSYLEWVREHNNEETRRFRSRLKYRYDNFKSNREIVLYLHKNNYMAGRLGSPTPNEVEDLLLNFSIWYEHRHYTDEENMVLSNFLSDNVDIDYE